MIKYVEVSGTHRQIGQAIGECLRGEIARALELFLPKLYQRPAEEVQALSNKLLENAKNYFPDFIEELEGMSGGARQPFEKLLWFSFEEELLPEEHCTTVAIKTLSTIFIGHNEDWDLDLPLYLVKAKPNNKPLFLSLAYAGQFPGTVGLNQNGFAFAENSVETPVNYRGIPKKYYLRALLEADSVDNALQMMRKHERSIGANVILASAKENRIVSAEFSPAEHVIQEIPQCVVHANHFIAPQLVQFQNKPASEGSRNRYQQGCRLIASLDNPSVEQMQKLLSNHEGYPKSVCSHGESKTIASVVVDVGARAMYVADGFACQSEYHAFSL